jgi:hypothetical protein
MVTRVKPSAILGLVAALVGPPACSAASDPEAESSGDEAVGTDDGSTPPTDGAALVPWLESDAYGGWMAESAAHVSAGPHGSTVRTFVNDALAAGLADGAASQPIGAAAVKELYDADDELIGWAVMVKVADDGGDGWYWYERAGSTEYADGTGERLCTGCHSSGVDFVRTPWPLQ